MSQIYTPEMKAMMEKLSNVCLDDISVINGKDEIQRDVDTYIPKELHSKSGQEIG